MLYSTNNNKSKVLAALILVASMTTSFAASLTLLPSQQKEAGCVNWDNDFDSANYLAAISIIGRPPIQLSPTMKEEQENNSHYDESAVSNATRYWKEAAASTTVDTIDTAIRFYPTWSEGQLCSSKSSSSFESWEESYISLEECCDVSFSWDYDACMQSA